LVSYFYIIGGDILFLRSRDVHLYLYDITDPLKPY